VTKVDDHHSGLDWGLQVGWLLKYLRVQGASPAEIESAIAGSFDAESDIFLPIDDYLLLLDWGTRRLAAPHLGLDIASKLESPDLGIFGYLVQHSPTVGAFILALERYQKIFMRGMNFSSSVANTMLELRWQIFRPPGEAVRQDIEFTLGAIVYLLREQLGENWTPGEASFMHSPREPLGRYEAVFGKHVSFNAPINNLVFDAAFCDTPLSDSDPKLLAILKQQADALLEQVESRQDLVGQVKLLITTSLEREEAGVDTVAGNLCVTPRTLNRKLSALGTSYKDLREDIVAETARRLLLETDASVTEITAKLGYSESSAFVRAFKRTAGITPLAYRKQSQIH